MSIATSAPIVYFNKDELTDFAKDIIDRLRFDPRLKSSLDLIVGNHWLTLEVSIAQVLEALLLRAPMPRFPADRLERVARFLSLANCHYIEQLFVEAIFSRFPLHDASALAEAADDLVRWITPLLEEPDLRKRQRRLIDHWQQWQAGTIGNAL